MMTAWVRSCVQLNRPGFFGSPRR